MPDIPSYLRSFRHLIHLPDGDGELLQRFRVKRDELAFATLVQRHGPMVLGIAQRILGQSDLLDDVFQATFLVLAKRGRHMETWPSVAGWLVQVARRTALQARAKSARRARHEQQAAAMTHTSITAEPAEVVSQRDLSRLLDTELARLPSKYRTPLVLCHLEGQTKEETARQLGWPVGSVSGRLARGKKLLQARLLRRGIVPALATSIFTMPAANAHLPSLLIQATTLLATNVVHQASQVPTGTAVVLAQGVMTSMFMTKVKYAASILLVLGLCLGTGAWAWQGKGNEATAPVQLPKNGAKQPNLLEQVQGEWFDGNGFYWVFRNNEVAVKDKLRMNPDNKNYSPFQINESTQPARILIGNLKGVIKMSEGKLYINYAKTPDATDVPEDFQESPTRYTMILRRVSDYDHLEGIWRKEERNPVTNEITYAEELMFRGHHYVRRHYGSGDRAVATMNGIPQLTYEYPPELFELHEAQNPKGIDFDIHDEAFFRKHQPLLFNDAEKLSKQNLVERTLSIYQLMDNEFKYAMGGHVPMALEGNRLVPNPKHAAARRLNSFKDAESPVQVYRRVATSYKDDAFKRGISGSGPTLGYVGSAVPSNNKKEEVSPQLQGLRQQRLKFAQERMKLWQQARASGNGIATMEDLGVISQQLLDAKLALAQEHASKVKAMEDHLKVVKQIEDQAEQRYKSGSMTYYHRLAVQLQRIEFEIQLQELKEKR